MGDPPPLAEMYADPETMRFIGPGGTVDLEGSRASPTPFERG